MLNILVANDDGIQASGIRHLVDALATVANVYVCAPDGQRSAAGHGMTMSKPMSATEVEYKNAKKAYAISGTPADCVKLGRNLLKQQGIEIDMVFSGINLGGNLGTDCIYSGTVAAAMEGHLYGYPAVAVSVDSHEAQHFEKACELAVVAAVNAYPKMKGDMILNINTPDVPPEEIPGVKFTRMGRREYDEFFKETVDENGNTQYWYGGDRVMYEGLPEEIDVIAHQNGYATITPLHFDMTAHDYINEIKEWGIIK